MSDDAPKIGRPTVCTDDLVDRLCAALRDGVDARGPMTLMQACEHVGVHRDTVRDWRDSDDPVRRAAWVRITHARQALPAKLLGEAVGLALHGSNDDSARAGMLRWLIDRLDPEPKHVELTGKDGGPLKHEHHVDPAALCDRIGALAAGAAGGAAAAGAAAGARELDVGGAGGDRRGGDGG